MFIRTLNYKIPYMKGDDVIEFQTLITRLGIDCGEIDGKCNKK